MVSDDKPTRAGSAPKRAAILAAARDLFLRDGVDRTSMDAISAEAEVSKRTVYDYFGAKANLLAAVVETAAEALIATLRESLERNLAGRIETPERLEEALTAFAIDLATTVVGSTNYATIFGLTSGFRTEVAPLASYSDAPEAALGEWLAHFAEIGLLDVIDPQEAASHFAALTMHLAYSHHADPTHADPTEIHRTVTGGVHAFMRAYGSPRPMR